MAVKVDTTNDGLTDEDIMRRPSCDNMHAAWVMSAILVGQGMTVETAADVASLCRRAVNERLVAEYREKMAAGIRG